IRSTAHRCRTSTDTAFHLLHSNAAFGKAIRRQEKHMLEAAMFIGLGLVAVWAYVRYPRLRPVSLVRALVHVVVSFLVFALLPMGLSLVLPVAPSPGLVPYVALSLVIPSVTYLLLSWVWLIARVLQDVGGTPRGGHPVAPERS